jgi:hypothetical protein
MIKLVTYMYLDILPEAGCLGTCLQASLGSPISPTDHTQPATWPRQINYSPRIFIATILRVLL